jgi:lysophospholipase L1-like esterase
LDLRLELYLTLHQIWQRSDGQPPKVLFTGYYDPFQGQTCAVLPNVDATESAWLSAKAAQVNNVIRESVTILGSATYVPVDFTGHGLCSADSWVQGLQAVAPTHPTAAGQQAIARAVAAAL